MTRDPGSEEKLAVLQRQLDAIERAKTQTNHLLHTAVAEQHKKNDGNARNTASTQGSTHVLSQSPLRGEARLAWEKAVIEDELSRPLEVDARFIRNLAVKEAETEARLLSELKVHAAALGSMRQKLLDREAAAERAYAVKAARDVGMQHQLSRAGEGAAVGPLAKPQARSTSLASTATDRAFAAFTATEAHVLSSLERLSELESRIGELEARTSGSAVVESLSSLGMAPITAIMPNAPKLSSQFARQAVDSKLESAYGGAHAKGRAGRAGIAADIGAPASGFAPALGLVYARKKVPGVAGSPARVVYAVESLERVTAQARAELGPGTSYFMTEQLYKADVRRKQAASGPGGTTKSKGVGAPRMSHSTGPALGREGALASTVGAARGRQPAGGGTGGGSARGAGQEYGGSTLQRARTVALGSDIARRLAAERERQAAKVARPGPARDVKRPGAGAGGDRMGARTAANKVALQSFDDIKKKFEAQKGAARAVTSGTRGAKAVPPPASTSAGQRAQPDQGPASKGVAGARKVVGKQAGTPRPVAPPARVTRPAGQPRRQPGAGAPVKAAQAQSIIASGLSIGAPSASRAGPAMRAAPAGPAKGKGKAVPSGGATVARAREQFGKVGVKMVTGAAAMQGL